MKKNLASNLFFFAGILYLLSGIMNEDSSFAITLACAFITFGIVFRNKGTSENKNEEVLSTENDEESN